MTRGFVSLLTILLVTGATGAGQTAAGVKSFIGMLRKIGDTSVVIESDDREITTISLARSTRYLSASGGSANPGDFQPGDRVNVGAKRDNKGAYHAVSIAMVREGSPEEHSAASLAMNDPSHPLRGKPDADTDAPRPAQTRTAPAQVERADSSDPPRLRRPSAPAESVPVAGAAAPSPSVGSETIRPQLRRPPASQPSPEPGAGDDEGPYPPPLRGNGVTRVPRQIPASGDPVIDQAREAAFAFSETLPNYVVKQYTTRYASAAARRGGTSWQVLDNVTADVIEENGTEKYKNVLINGKPPVRGVEQTGSWSRGEFSSLLLDVLSPITNADFRGQRAATIVNRAAFRYDFSVEQPNSHWHVEVDSGAYMPGYSGAIWIDKENSRVLRIEMSAERMPASFALDQVEWAVDYDYVLIGESKYLLPVHSESLSCGRASSQCTRNVIEFRNYRKFTADTSITFEP